MCDKPASIVQHTLEKAPIIYPNPTDNILNIHPPDGSKPDYIISNVMGKIILASNSTSADIAQWPAGIYYIRFTKRHIGPIYRCALTFTTTTTSLYV